MSIVTAVVVPLLCKVNELALFTMGVVTDVEPDKVVNEPAAAAVPPIAGGEARYVENPVPLTVLDADNVVNAPAAAAVPPMAGGLAK